MNLETKAKTETNRKNQEPRHTTHRAESKDQYYRKQLPGCSIGGGER